MAEVLLRVRSHRDEKGNVIAGRLRAGEVVAIRANGWPWSDAERTNPDWRIIEIPRVAVARLSRLVEPLTDAEKLAGVQPTKRRLWRINIAALNATLADPVKQSEWLADATKAEAHLLATVEAAD